MIASKTLENQKNLILQLENFVSNVKLVDGIWMADSVGHISYPEDGSEFCLQLEDKSFWFRYRNELILKSCEEYLVPGSRFLDIGGGNGYVARALQRAGYDTVLIEPSMSGCIAARGRGINHIINGDLQNTQINPSGFDAVGMFDVLEHIEDRISFLKEAKKVLKPGGKLILTVPAYKTLWSKEDDHAGHYTRYTRKTLRKDLEAAGFQVDYINVFFWALWPAIFLFRTIPGKLGINTETESNHDFPGWLQKLINLEKPGLNKKRFQPIGSSLIGVAKIT